MSLNTNKQLSFTLEDITKASSIINGFDPYVITTDKENTLDVKTLSRKKSSNHHTEVSGSKDIRINLIKINDWGLDFLCDFIISNHHKYIRKILPVILTASKLMKGKKHNDSELYNALVRMKNDFEIHMQKEERLLFPYIKKMNKIYADKSDYETPPFGSALNLIKVFEKEHGIAEKTLIKIGKIFRNSDKFLKNIRIKNALNEHLNEFNSDFHFHIYLENNILFPKAVSLEKKLKKFKNLNT